MRLVTIPHTSLGICCEQGPDFAELRIFYRSNLRFGSPRQKKFGGLKQPLGSERYQASHPRATASSSDPLSALNL
ncbi:hypothetical protein PGTUg99_017654 [Puccinia graminis f. sp. tritici]|uniref:Uncharacterized protein n=1 Tax=Puccinia graminis f. sp. tritici TaxID=56615 RepID=A0A5B0PJ80_PUCGR|nr:hypothetical protein PGTUg99_017654 [Puccinia graminis f. sp. tritici]